jgi:tRNA threonylcarbamoyladenosine biosynthesis protein TsaB
MKVLAFDCAGAQCAAAITVDGHVVASARIEAERGHARLLMPMLCGLLEGANLAFTDIDRFAVTTGPGSFTGIRVALATAHGLSIGTGKPAIGITVFEALAAKAAAARAAQAGIAAPRLLIAIESRRAECFAQLFDAEGRKLTEARILPPESIAAWVGPGRIALAGDAAWRLTPYLADCVDGSIDIGMADPGIIANLSETRIPGPAPAPFYLRDADAIKLSDR